MPRPIEAVGTSTAAFVGVAPGGPADQAVRVASVAEYDAAFGAGATHSRCPPLAKNPRTAAPRCPPAPKAAS